MKALTRLKSWLTIAVAVLLVLAVDQWSRLPAERLAALQTIVVPPEQLQLVRGVARFALPDAFHGMISDLDGTSSLQLLEDGVKLLGHSDGIMSRSSHARKIRFDGAYSHWADDVFFKSRDGSDPRTSGRRYEIRVPPKHPRAHRVGQAIALAAAAILFLIGIHRVCGGSIVRSALTAALVVIALAAGMFAYGTLGPNTKNLDGFASQFRRITDAAIATAAAPAGGHRTRHLLRAAIEPQFTTGAEPRKIQGRRSIDAVAEAGRHNQFRHREPLNIDPSDLETLVIRITSTEAEMLVVHFTADGDIWADRGITRISIPLQRSDDLQALHLQRPALGGDCKVVNFITITTDGPAQLESMTYTRRLDEFHDATHGKDSVDLNGSLRPCLWQSVPGAFTFPTGDTDGLLLKLAIGGIGRSKRQPIDYRIIAVDDGDSRTVVHRGRILTEQAWKELAIPLRGDLRWKQLIFESDHVPEDSVLFWSGLRLIDTTRPARRVIMILIDTQRADWLGCYGRAGNPSPHLDRLAQQGVRFERAFSQSYWTRPSMPSIMTGCYVSGTGIQRIDQRLPGRYETLAERFGDAGFTTVSILTNANAGPAAGLEQGFGRVTLPTSMTDRQRHHTQTLIDDIVNPTVSTLDDDDLFFYLHLMEVHAPYGPHERPPELQLPAGGRRLIANPYFDRPWLIEPTADQRIALYAYDIASMDRALGRLLKDLDRRWRSPAADTGDGEPRPPIVAVTSDHGECLGERGEWGHEFGDLYPDLVQVPLIIRAPGRIAPRTAYHDPVEIRHLGATLLDLVDIPYEASNAEPSVYRWHSLMPQLDNAAPAQPFAISSGGQLHDGEVFSLFGSRTSYVSRVTDARARVNVYRDQTFSHQTTAYWPTPVLRNKFFEVRQAYLESQAPLRAMLWVGHDSDRILDPKVLERLKALGYLGE